MTPSRPATAQETVLARLRGDILTGILRPGEQVVQEAIADRYGVSRVPLREALKVLEGEGLVTYHRHRGYFVTVLGTEELLEVYRLREVLEAEAIAAAVPALDDAALAHLADVLAELEAATADRDVAAAMDANRRLHFGIFEASGMPRLVRLLRQLWDATDAYRTLYFASEANLRRVDAEHRAILEALRARDARRVRELHDAHRANAVKALRVALGG